VTSYTDAVPACPNCGEENPDKARFCWSCGSALAEAEAPSEVRKTVTVVFSDVSGSTSLGERTDPESLRRVMSRYFDEMRDVVEAHGGVVEKFIGDAVMAVFGIPHLHEDDALRAVRAAAEMRSRLEDLNDELERTFGVRIAVRTGVNTGEVVAGDSSEGQRLVTGDAVNVAARLEQAAQPGEILLGADTHRLVRAGVEAETVEPLSLKGKAEAVPAFRLLEVSPDATVTPRHLDSPMVGRDRQRRVLEEAFDQAVTDRVCHLFTVLGAAGVGKSRLVQEFLAGLGDRGQVLSGRCLSYGEGITFWPLAEVVHRAAATTDADSPEVVVAKLEELLEDVDDAPLIAARVAQAVGFAEGQGPAEETFWAVRKLFESLARERPLVLVLDDLHWGEPTLLDLVEHIADWTRDAPILLLCVARQELLDVRASWGGGKRSATTISLEPLNEAESDQLIHNLLGRADLPMGIEERITEAAEGNPLFVEEMVAMLIDDGHLRRENGRWVGSGDLAAVTVPLTIQALLAARLDRLQRPERAVIERASVEGKVFHGGAVAALAPEEIRSAVPAHLMALIRKELVRPDRSTFVGQEGFRFRHLLIRDAAYHAMPKETRADLHQRFATWLGEVAADRISEYEEFLGYHLEQAFRYRAELGPVDDLGQALAAEAAGHLTAAGWRAADRGDFPAASSLWRRAIDLLPATDPNGLRLMADLADVLIDRGELREAEAVTDQAIAGARAIGDAALEAAARVPRLHLDGAVNQKPTAEILREAREALGVLQASGDRRAELGCSMLIAKHEYFMGNAAMAGELLRPLIEEARSLGDVSAENRMRAWMCAYAYWGPMPVVPAIAEVERLVADAPFRRVLEANGGRILIGLYAMQGRFDEARALASHLVEVGEELGLKLWSSTLAFWTGPLEELAGDHEAAAREFRQSYESLAEMGEVAYASTLAGELARQLVTLQRLDEAERYAAICRDTSAEDDFASQALWRQVFARILVRRGDLAGAVRMAGEAVALCEASDYVIQIENSLIDEAEVLRLAGLPEEAASSLLRARAMAEAKGDVARGGLIAATLAGLG
jgi:class 3 adenylate cyclase/tetratricopeptide (TPR) repeat protein